MMRPAISLRQWTRLRQSLSLSSAAPNLHAILLTPSANPLALQKQNPGSKRTFHNTRAQHAARKAPMSPAARAKRRDTTIQSYDMPELMGRSGSKVMNRDGFFMACLGDALDPDVHDAWYKRHFDSIPFEFDKAIEDGFIPKAISFKTFKTVKTKLMDAALSARPNAQAIRAISVACAMAKARIPLILVTKRAMEFSKVPSRTEWTTEIEKLAVQGYPPALVLHAKMLGLRGEHKDAIDLLEQEVLPFITPTQQLPKFFDDIMLMGQLESPWRLYALFLARYDAIHNDPEARRKSDEAIKTAAIEYHDPDALLEYAFMMMNENNLDSYEEAMLKSATSGNGSACFFLANFYYLTYHGKYPTRGERAKQYASGQAEPSKEMAKTKSSGPASTSKKQSSQLWTWVTSFFGQSMKREEYRALAQDWYQVAYHHGNKRAAFMLGLLCREDGDLADGFNYLTDADMENDKYFADRLLELKANWLEKDYSPKVPKRMLAVQ
ncbi:uncharacterized protein N7443_009156 [Penicillium atrosanguineum]|uniref:uncharacterized protein n=1 Tax=Penicillium atrosanguineum TaxID=1132637 RepID=UPI002391C9FE|nr:uncharacterized protein N7443_009156 [Penicillium atrosanguineum]KAJ5293203.1 hypothetical protein N7443_009156 [Penicillium atrosanguineum]